MFLLHPWFLLLVLLPLGLLVFNLKTTQQGLSRHFSKAMLEKLSVSQNLLGEATRYRLFLLALSLFVLALARPVVEKKQLDTSESKASLIIAIDFSASMHNTDIYPSRLALAQKKGDTLLAQAQHLEIGILLYANDAYMLYPISQNPRHLRNLFNDANITQHFTKNTNLFAALEASEVLLEGHHNKHILILSDGGAEVSRAKELHYLQKHHTTLSALSLNPTLLPSMQNLCQTSGGVYQHYTWGDEDVQTLLGFFAQAHPDTQTYHYALKQYHEYYHYPLLLGLLILLLLWVPRTSPMVLLLCFVNYSTTPSQAGLLDMWTAYQQAKAYNQATQTYKQKHYIDAVTLYTQALGTDKVRNAKIYHNIATAYARTHKLRLAKQYYKKALQSFVLPQTQENLAIIKKQLKIERKNLHKKYQKLHFKAIVAKQIAYKTPFTTYAVKLHKLLPNEEQQWFDKVLQHKSPLYLQKIPTHLRSLDANLSY